MYQQYGGNDSKSKNNNNYKFTVFTPTYNRAHTIERVYESLKVQTFRDFEWLIVDDGSSDNTKDLIEFWKKEANFDIHYIYKDNGGKHTAINRGVQEARGELFLIHDSDDSCIPETLERFNYHWESISLSKRHEFSGVTVLCMDTKGKLVGDKFPEDICDMSPIKMNAVYGVRGEKWGFHKTDVFKEFPFPEIPGENFFAEGLIWNKMAVKYKIRHVNEMLRIYEYTSDGLSASLLKIRIKNPVSTRYYYKEFNRLPVPFKLRVKNLINYIRFSLHGNVSIWSTIRESSFFLLTILLLPVGYLFYQKDLSILKK